MLDANVFVVVVPIVLTPGQELVGSTVKCARKVSYVRVSRPSSCTNGVVFRLHTSSGCTAAVSITYKLRYMGLKKEDRISYIYYQVCTIVQLNTE